MRLEGGGWLLSRHRTAMAAIQQGQSSAGLDSARDLEMRAEEGLPESQVTAEGRLRLVMRAANIGFWEWNIKTNAVYHSPEWKRQLGYEDHEVTNELNEWQSRLHPEDSPRVQAMVADFLHNPRPGYDVEFRLRHRDGSYRWIHSHGLLVRDGAGVPTRLLGVHVDITASKTREIALRKGEERYRRLVEATAIIPWEADARTWRFTYVGPRAVSILGYPAQEWLVPDFWMTHLDPADQAIATQRRRDRSAQVEDFESEYRMRAADGRVVWFQDIVHVVRSESGPDTLQGFLIDVTERRRAAEEHARLAAIVEGSNDAIIGEGLDGTITSWNKSAERIYGYTAGEVLGRSVRMLVPRDRAPEVAQILARMKRGETIAHMETRRVTKTGREIHISLVVSPIRDAHGQITGASAIARDITDRKQLEAEVLQISEREQQRIAQDLHDGLGQLLSGTAHLSNALQVELALQALPDAAEALRITELLNQAVAETRSLARGLFPVRPEPNGLMVALKELAARTHTLFGVTCRLDCRKPVRLEQNALATHLYRIAQEAVSNALKHGQARIVRILLSANTRRLTLSVIDNGTGYQAEPNGPPGMGIRIMHYRAGMIGGSLDIRNNSRGRGARVTCCIPRRPGGLWNPTSN